MAVHTSAMGQGPDHTLVMGHESYVLLKMELMPEAKTHLKTKASDTRQGRDGCWCPASIIEAMMLVFDSWMTSLLQFLID